MRHTGLPQNFLIKAANVSDAAAVVRRQDRYILYSQSFMLRVIDEARSDWSAVSIMAHEICHHLAGHTLKSGGSRPRRGGGADRYDSGGQPG